MTFTKYVGVALLATLLVLVVQPARAEAMDPILISVIVSAGVVVVVLVAILIIANASEGRQRMSQVATPTHQVIAFESPAPVTESP